MLPSPTMPASKKTAARHATKTKPDGRKKSLFTRVGDEAKREAQRKLLLATLKEHDWNLTATAEVLELGFLQAVIRALKDLAPEEYARAKADGRISPANRR